MQAIMMKLKILPVVRNFAYSFFWRYRLLESGWWSVPKLSDFLADVSGKVFRKYASQVLVSHYSVDVLHNKPAQVLVRFRPHVPHVGR